MCSFCCVLVISTALNVNSPFFLAVVRFLGRKAQGVTEEKPLFGIIHKETLGSICYIGRAQLLRAKVECAELIAKSGLGTETEH